MGTSVSPCLETLVDVGQDLHYLFLGAGVLRRHLVDDARHQDAEHAFELGIVGETQRGERLAGGSLRGHVVQVERALETRSERSHLRREYAESRTFRCVGSVSSEHDVGRVHVLNNPPALSSAAHSSASDATDAILFARRNADDKRDLGVRSLMRKRRRTPRAEEGRGQRQSRLRWM